MLSKIIRSAEVGLGASSAGETAGMDICLLSVVLRVAAPYLRAKGRKSL